MWAIGEPSGPIENGTTYIVRPSMQPSKRSLSVSRISPGSRQLLVGPGVLLALGADEGAVLHARHVGRVGAAPGRSWGAWRPRGARTCRRPPAPGPGGRTPRPSRRTSNIVRLGQGGDLVHPGLQLLVLGRDGALAHGYRLLLGSLALVGRAETVPDPGARRPHIPAGHPGRTATPPCTPKRPGRWPRPRGGPAVTGLLSGGSGTPAPAGTSGGWSSRIVFGSRPGANPVLAAVFSHLAGSGSPLNSAASLSAAA